MTVVELVARAKAGDHPSFTQLVLRYRTRIVALALHISGSASDAEDIAQDVFLSCYRKLHSFEGRSHFFTWLYRMAVNRALNVRRQRLRRRESDLCDPRVDRAVAFDARQNPLLAAELRRMYKHLVAALDALPEEMCASVVLVTLQGLSHKDAARVQGCSTGTISWRIHQARKRLSKARRLYVGDDDTQSDIFAAIRSSLCHV